MKEEVILVNEMDEPVGQLEKMQAHQEGLLHRAFSIFILNDKGEMLLHKRAKEKYHSGGLWTNACCSHPRPSESVLDAAHRRLNEEMGMQCELRASFSFIYKAKLDNDLTEHELDHVLIGNYSDAPNPNTNEVEDWKYLSVSTIQKEIQLQPEAYTEWFKIAFPIFCEKNNIIL